MNTQTQAVQSTPVIVNGRDMTHVSRPLQIGERLVLIAEKNAFGIRDKLGEMLAQDILRSLHFVEITISEETAVGGNYKPEDSHWGYRAKGSDGWHYTCQWKKFDDCSMQPYSNWQREYLPGVHYNEVFKDGRSEIGTWIIKETEFTEHYLNWDVTSFRQFPPVMMVLVIEHINKQFPDTKVTVCNVEDRGPDGPFNHSRYGLHYDRPDGCFLCSYRSAQKLAKAECSLAK